MADLPYIADLAGLNACGPALNWLRAEQHPTLADAWAVCPRGDWMLWLIGRTTTYAPPWSDERKPLVAAAMECARLALPVYEKRTGKSDVREASGVVLAWTRGEETMDKAREARGRLWGAYTAAAAADAAIAAAADAAIAAADATADARSKTLAACADIVRAHFPTPPEVPRV